MLTALTSLCLSSIYITDECSYNQCTNNGTCIDGINTFTCACPRGFTGLYCEQRNYDDVCNTSVCGGGIYCIDNYVNNTAYCVCNESLRFGKDILRISSPSFWPESLILSLCIVHMFQPIYIIMPYFKWKLMLKTVRLVCIYFL